MKFRSLVFSLMLIVGVLAGCDDDLKYVGGTIQPDGDKINVTVDSFQMTTSTIKIDSIYAKTSTGYLGQFFDPQYGDYKADYICQFYSKEGFKFQHEPIDGSIDSVKFIVSFSSYIGDSLSPMKAEVFPVIKPLERNYYTNINPEDYCDMQNSLGEKAYTIYNSVTNKRLTSLEVFLDKELGQRIYEETINNPSSFANQDAFNRFFPGLYVTNTYGIGTVLTVAGSYMNIYYRYEDSKKDSKGNDSTFVVNANELFMVTNEVIQMNRMSSYGLDALLQPNDDYTYLKTPAGVYTKVVIPAKEILDRIGDRIINNFPLTFKALPQDDWEFASRPPKYLLLLPEDSLKTFFENRKLHDNITAYLGSYSNNVYHFSNIARLLKTHKEKAPDQDLNLLLLPVEATEPEVQGGSISAISTYQAPMGMTLRKDPEVMRIKVTTSKYNE